MFKFNHFQALIAAIIVITVLLSGCGAAEAPVATTEVPAPTEQPAATEASAAAPPAVASDDSSVSTSFTNKYGTPTTLCAHAGCNNYIASSGDTNCCTVHSNRCLNCNKYIDEDAVYCMSCLSGSITNSQSSSKSSSSSSSSTAGGPGKCKYKVGSTFVCSKNATNGNFCKEHYDYLNDAYNSLFG